MKENGNSSGFAIEARDLLKNYDSLIAVNRVSISVLYGEAFGLLGPNGAGKSTIMRMIYCRTPLTSGSLHVVGLDVTRDPRTIKASVGVVPQENNLDPDLNVRKNLLVYARYFRIPRRVAERRADELIEFIGLSDKRDSRIEALLVGIESRDIDARECM